MRILLLAVLLPTFAFGQAISGTFTGTFENFDSFGIPQVRLNLSLQCSLTCDASAPTLHYGAAGGVWAYFVNSPMDSAAYIGSGFGSADNGQNSYVNTNFKAGSVSFGEAKSCTCHCGNRTGEGGYVTLRTANIVVPSRLVAPTLSRPNRESSVILTASPKGSESIVVSIVGAGLNETQTYTTTEFGTQDSVFVRFTPLTAGMVTVTATMQPSGVATTETYEIKADTTASGGGSGSTGGGSGGGGGADVPAEGCSAVGFGPWVLLAALAFLRRPLSP
jgi:hypothetical protein